MYQVEKNTKFYIFDCCKKVYIKEFDSEDVLIEFLAKDFYLYLNGDFYSEYFYNLNMNGNDIAVASFFFDERYDYKLRPYIFLDSDDRIIDIRDYKEEIVKRVKDRINKENLTKKEKDFCYNDVLYNQHGRFCYRVGPVPNAFYYRRYHGIRHPKTINEIRQNFIPEYKSFIRPKRKNIPTAWDNIPRIPQKSWKKQSKKRKQWM